MAVDRNRAGCPHDVSGGEFAGRDVVGQDRGQLSLVLGLQQAFQRTGRQLGEGFVGRSKDRERPLSLQDIHQPGGLDSGDERVELTAGSDCRIDDVMPTIRGFCT